MSKATNPPPRMADCPQFDHCSAPICPLDPERVKRRYVPSDPVCFYMRELIKPDGVPRLESAIGPYFIRAVREAVEEAESAHGPLHRRLKRAKSTPSRLEVS